MRQSSGRALKFCLWQWGAADLVLQSCTVLLSLWALLSKNAGGHEREDQISAGVVAWSVDRG